MRPIFIYPVKECSKRLKQKNLLQIDYRPLFTYAFSEVLIAASKYKNSTVVFSTENKKVRLYIKSHYDRYILNKNSIIHNRLKKYAQDPYQNIHVCALILKDFADLADHNPLVLVQPTNPFITADDICNCIDAYEKELKYSTDIEVRTVKELPNCKMYENEFATKYVFINKVDSYTRYFQSLGSIVVTDTAKFLEWDGNIDSIKWENSIIPYVLPKDRAIDIDDETDFLIAKSLMENK